MNRSEDPEHREPFPVGEELQGQLLEWLARDARDHVALFTAIAPVELAPEVMDRLQEHRRALAAILGVPATTRSVFGPPVGNERGERWRALVERGLFVFAAHRSGGPYWIAEAPQLPLSVRELPPSAREHSAAAEPQDAIGARARSMSARVSASPRTSCWPVSGVYERSLLAKSAPNGVPTSLNGAYPQVHCSSASSAADRQERFLESKVASRTTESGWEAPYTCRKATCPPAHSWTGGRVPQRRVPLLRAP